MDPWEDTAPDSPLRRRVILGGLAVIGVAGAAWLSRTAVPEAGFPVVAEGDRADSRDPPGEPDIDAEDRGLTTSWWPADDVWLTSASVPPLCVGVEDRVLVLGGERRPGDPRYRLAAWLSRDGSWRAGTAPSPALGSSSALVVAGSRPLVVAGGPGLPAAISDGRSQRWVSIDGMGGRTRGFRPAYLDADDIAADVIASSGLARLDLGGEGTPVWSERDAPRVLNASSALARHEGRTALVATVAGERQTSVRAWIEGADGWDELPGLPLTGPVPLHLASVDSELVVVAAGATTEAFCLRDEGWVAEDGLDRATPVHAVARGRRHLALAARDRIWIRVGGSWHRTPAPPVRPVALAVADGWVAAVGAPAFETLAVFTLELGGING